LKSSTKLERMSEKNPLIKSEPTAEEIAEKAAKIRKKWSRAEYYRRAADRMPPNWDQELSDRPEMDDDHPSETRYDHDTSNSPEFSDPNGIEL
jgi:hypothetical protein